MKGIDRDDFLLFTDKYALYDFLKVKFIKSYYV